MTDRYGIFSTEDSQLLRSLHVPASHGVIDLMEGHEFRTADLKTAVQLAKLLNIGQDCRFNCRTQKQAYEAGWMARHDYVCNPCGGGLSERYREWKKKR